MSLSGFYILTRLHINNAGTARKFFLRHFFYEERVAIALYTLRSVAEYTTIGHIFCVIFNKFLRKDVGRFMLGLSALQQRKRLKNMSEDFSMLWSSW